MTLNLVMSFEVQHKGQLTEDKIDLNFIKIKNFSNKVVVKRMKRQDTDWEKYLQNIYVIKEL